MLIFNKYITIVYLSINKSLLMNLHSKNDYKELSILLEFALFKFLTSCYHRKYSTIFKLFTIWPTDWQLCKNKFIIHLMIKKVNQNEHISTKYLAHKRDSGPLFSFFRELSFFSVVFFLSFLPMPDSSSPGSSGSSGLYVLCPCYTFSFLSFVPSYYFSPSCLSFCLSLFTPVLYCSSSRESLESRFCPHLPFYSLDSLL